MSEVPPSPVEPFRPLPDRTWRERLDELVERARQARHTGRVLLAAGAVLAVVIVAIALIRPVDAGTAPEATLPRASEAPAVAPAASSTPEAIVVVQAAGAVVRPGSTDCRRAPESTTS